VFGGASTCMGTYIATMTINIYFTSLNKILKRQSTTKTSYGQTCILHVGYLDIKVN
jgi:hypothetical protein